MHDGENGYDGEGNEDYEVDGGQSGDVENNGDEERPKLAEGFFEIETLRKTRTRKGVKQYLIKWRGWPESANTWEPAESFTSCPDVIEAFESMSSGKRKRKRKHAVDSVSQSKKKKTQKQQDSPDMEEPCPGTRVHNSNVTENNVTANQSNELEGKFDETNATSFMNQENMTKFAIHIQEDPVEPANGVSKIDGTEVLRASPRVGARRRKSCAVKQFKKESNAASKKTTPASDVIDVVVQDDIKNAEDVINGLDSENNLETPKSIPVITQIIKPVNYSVSVLDDTEEVCVSFLVTRSDGEEIVVDNKYLKENDPVLLINFYEQHLRYNSPCE
ncbi:hypothetical protein L1987_60709 [Smallanthus sonchifolius]|uniref:Uncharacterized protein n=1 Tax=Smallanthus sonchifolius TaxID=185202 RepID=A0ACB9D966_9ASTR|nr:hypothetical protein L1987_60709 [Smallanthus sonchifolius]